MDIRILLADDNQQFRTVIRQFLDQVPHLQVVAEVGDGNTAVEQAQALKPDLVSMDVKMPNCDGVEATARILSLVPSARVLALSLYAEPRVIRDMIDAGAMGYVSKADAFEDLVPAIHAVAGGETYFSASLPPPFGTGEDPDCGPGEE